EAFEDLEGRVIVLAIGEDGEVVRSTGASPVNDQAETNQHGRGARATGHSYDWNQHPYRVRLAMDLVRFEPGDEPIARHLLGKTVIVDELATAAALHKEGPAGFRYVTIAGEV